jgi:hypothetical protein
MEKYLWILDKSNSQSEVVKLIFDGKVDDETVRFFIESKYKEPLICLGTADKYKEVKIHIANITAEIRWQQ